MLKNLLTFLFLLQSIIGLKAQDLHKLDSILSLDKENPFNGVVFLVRNDKRVHVIEKGYSNIESKTKIKYGTDQFVVGSISKQFTAVIVLQEVDSNRLQLHTPIKKYLPYLTQSWADSVTVHHLLTHTHGIVALDKPSEFKAGSKFSYSQLSYQLLSEIVEKTSGKSFAQLSVNLFKSCRMENTFHPDNKQYKHLVKAYTKSDLGKLEIENASFENYPAAGSFVSTVNDLALWNAELHNNYHVKLLKPETYKLMITKQPNAIRNHPLFGTTYYGYGITITENNGVQQLGQTGFAPGFVSMNYYFPAKIISNFSLTILENVDYGNGDLMISFKHHLAILEFIKKELVENSN